MKIRTLPARSLSDELLSMQRCCGSTIARARQAMTLRLCSRDTVGNAVQVEERDSRAQAESGVDGGRSQKELGEQAVICNGTIWRPRERASVSNRNCFLFLLSRSVLFPQTGSKLAHRLSQRLLNSALKYRETPPTITAARRATAL